MSNEDDIKDEMEEQIYKMTKNCLEIDITENPAGFVYQIDSDTELYGVLNIELPFANLKIDIHSYFLSVPDDFYISDALSNINFSDRIEDLINQKVREYFAKEFKKIKKIQIIENGKEKVICYLLPSAKNLCKPEILGKMLLN